MLFFTNISFADTNDIKQTIKDIELVNNNINIIVKKVIGDEKLDINALEKDIKFSESILGERTKKVSSLYTTESNAELKNGYSILLNSLSYYALTLSNLEAYIHDESKVSNFIDTCANYRQGNITLLILQSIYE